MIIVSSVFDFIKNKDAESIKAYIDKGGDIDITNSDDSTLLHESIRNDIDDISICLIQAGANVIKTINLMSHLSC